MGRRSGYRTKVLSWLGVFVLALVLVLVVVVVCCLMFAIDLGLGAVNSKICLGSRVHEVYETYKTI